MKRFFSFLFCGGVFLLSGCSLNSSDGNTQPSALVSIYALSPATSAMNLFVNDANIATSVPFGSYTLYNQVAAGETRLRVQTATLNPAYEATFSITAGNYYSLFLIDSNRTSLRSLLVRDNLANPGDSVYLRFFNFSPDAPAVDIYSYSDSTNHTTIWKNRSYDSLPPTSAINTFTAFKRGTYNFYILKSNSTTNDTLAKFIGRNLTAAGYYTLLLDGNFKSGNDTTLQFGIRQH